MNIRCISALALLAFAGLAFAAPTAAQTSIAVVDVQRLMNESAAAKNIQRQIQEHKERFLAELSRQEQALRAEEQALAEEGKSLPQEEFARKRKAFEQKFLEARNLARKRKAALDKALGQGLERLEREIIAVVGAIAEEKDYDLVLTRQNVVTGDSSIDISAEALERLNKSVSEITLEIDSN